MRSVVRRMPAFRRSHRRMTAHAVTSKPAVAPASRGTPAAGSAPDPAAPGHFDHQLHAARQRHAPRDSDPSPMSPNARGMSAKEHPASQRQTDASTTAPTSTAAAAAPAAQDADAAKTRAPDAKAPADARDGDDQAASALAGAMLALIAPSVAGALHPGAATPKAIDVLAQAGKTATTDANAALLLQLGDPAGAAAATGNPAVAVAASAGMLAGAEGLLPIATLSKDSARADATPTSALPGPAPLAAPAAPTVLQLPSPIGGQTFAQDLGQQVAWLSGQNVKQARIRLHPEELGSLDVKVSVTHGRVDVVFSAQHPAAVAAVQQSLPQLDHMLAQHGLSLGHAEVGQQHRGDRHGHGGDAGMTAVDEAGEIHAAGLTTSLGQVGLLDAFA
jgi:flagellar hook-length control protein FliK